MQKLQPQAKLVWATTTPFMPDKNTGNFAVEQQNAIAAVIMTANAIPSVDLYARVTAKCGELCKGGLFVFGNLVYRVIGVWQQSCQSQANDHGAGTVQRSCVPDLTCHTLSH